MKRLMKRFILAFVLVLVTAVGCGAKQPELKKFYTCNGTDPGGSTYTVFMETQVLDGKTQFRQTTSDGNVILIGEGFYSDNRFIGIEWFGGNPAQAGVIEYTFKGKTLVGKWKLMGDPKVYAETCVESTAPTPPPPNPAEAPRRVDPKATERV